MNLTELIEKKAEIEQELNHQITEVVNEIERLKMMETQLKNELAEQTKPINDELIEQMKGIGVKEIKTQSGVTATFSAVDASKPSYWSKKLDSAEEKHVVEQLEELKPQYVKVEEKKKLNISEIKKAVKDGELFITSKGEVVDENGELLSDLPIFKLRDEKIEVH